MMHVDDGVLMAYADDELEPSERAATAEHILACPVCRARLEELRRASDTLSGALDALDPAPPVDAARAAVLGASRTRAAETAKPFIRAAIFVFLLAAGASAAVPGSPVRAWLGTALGTAWDADVTETRVLDTTSGVSIAPAKGRVEIAVRSLADGTTLRVRSVSASRASVTVPEAATPPLFRTSPGRIEVEGVSGPVLIDVPESVEEVRVLVDGVPYVVGSGATLRAAVTAETRDGELTFRFD